MRLPAILLLAASALSCSDEPRIKDPDLIRVEIVGMYEYEEGGAGVFLQGDNHRIVPIVIGDFEARALKLALAGRTTPRPLAYDLLEKLLDESGGTMSRLIVHSIVDNVFHGRLELIAGSRVIDIDCRPSDGMVLATRAKAPIYVPRRVMDQAGTDSRSSKRVMWRSPR